MRVTNDLGDAWDWSASQGTQWPAGDWLVMTEGVAWEAGGVRGWQERGQPGVPTAGTAGHLLCLSHLPPLSTTRCDCSAWFNMEYILVEFVTSSVACFLSQSFDFLYVFPSTSEFIVEYGVYKCGR